MELWPSAGSKSFFTLCGSVRIPFYKSITLNAFVKSQILGWVRKKLHIRDAEISNYFGVLRYVEMI